MPMLDDAAFRLLFLDAHTHNGWLDRPVDDALLRRLYELVRMAPTSANTQPMRLLFVKSPAAKEQLRPALDAGNVDKTMKAPVTAIVAYDVEFYQKIAKLLPQMPELGQRIAAQPPANRERMAFLSATLQGGYLILAARGLGLDCGPMGGFNAAAVDTTFFPDGKWRSIFLLNLGYGDATKVRPRAPRLEFDEACKIA